MGKEKSDDEDGDLFLSEEAAEAVDLEDLVATIHSAEIWEPSQPKRRGRSHRSARRRLDDLAQDRALRDALVDWDDYYGEYEEYASH